MTREEQIIKTAKEYYPKNGISFPLQMRSGFITGAQWADEHPNLYNNEKYHTVKVSCLDELNRKAVLYDALLEKACEWLNNNAKNYTIYGGLAIESLIYSFKKAMEE